MRLEKFNPFLNDIIFVDGLWAAGKALLCPIVSTMDRVEKAKDDPIYEYVCILRHLDKISPDAASSLMKIYADLTQYHNLVGREVNLRWRDITGPRNNLGSLKYVSRLFEGEGDKKISEINDNNIAFINITRVLLPVADSIFESYGPRAKIVELVRHPLYLVTQWYSYVQRFDSPREFTISFNHRGKKVPWFAHGWEDDYVDASPMDKTLLSITKLYDWLHSSIRQAMAKRQQVLVLSFESLVIDPDEPLQRLSSFVGRKHHPRLSGILRKQRVPRKTVSQGERLTRDEGRRKGSSSEESIYARYMNLVMSEGSRETVDTFLASVDTYNEQFPSPLGQYR